jgi:hypothetical protein
MSFFTPFAFIKEEAAPFTWTPEDLTGLKYWFRADEGITLSGTDVISWTPKVGSLTLEDQTSSAPVFVSSYAGWNNRAAIKFNDGVNNDALIATSRYTVSSTDYHFIWFIAEANSNANGGFQILGGDGGPDAANQEYVLMANTDTNNNAWSTYNFDIELNGGSTDSNVGGAISSFKGWAGVAVNNSNKNAFMWRNGTEISTWTSGLYGWADGTEGIGAGLTVGNYGLAETLGFKGHVFEVGVMTSKPTAQEIADMQTYINTYYGVSYST